MLLIILDIVFYLSGMWLIITIHMRLNKLEKHSHKPIDFSPAIRRIDQIDPWHNTGMRGETLEQEMSRLHRC